MKRFTYEEMILVRALELNSLLPHYWSEMFTLMTQLLDEDEMRYFQLQLKKVEDMVLTTAQIESGRSLYDIEMAIESNPDFYAYFENPRGAHWLPGALRKRRYSEVTKFDIERELSNIKRWIFSVIRKRAETKRFSRFR